MHNKTIHMISFLLLIVGGLNWLLIGALNFNLVTTLVGDGGIAQVVYILVGLAAIFELITHKATCKTCQ